MKDIGVFSTALTSADVQVIFFDVPKIEKKVT